MAATRVFESLLYTVTRREGENPLSRMDSAVRNCFPTHHSPDKSSPAPRIWKVATTAILGDPQVAVANGFVYVLSNDLPHEQSTFYALDAASGREQWSHS